MVKSTAGIFVQAVDRLAFKVIEALHRLFGFQYSRNQEFYVYQKTFTPDAGAAAGTSLTGSIRITQEADFVATRMNILCRVKTKGTNGNDVGTVIGASSLGPAAGDWPDPNCLVSLTDGSNDRSLMNEPADALGLAGFGGLPGVWPKARLFARNTNLSISLTTIKAPAVNDEQQEFRIQFIGFKIYDQDALDLTSRRA